MRAPLQSTICRIGAALAAIHFTKDAVLLAYCAGGKTDKNRLARLRIARLARARLE